MFNFLKVATPKTKFDAQIVTFEWESQGIGKTYYSCVYRSVRISQRGHKI